ncbi:MAG: hypothetical protein IKV94_01665 [Clostridia bacterium]|nr:hypothetical protein [Clostridia bacterium]
MKKESLMLIIYNILIALFILYIDWNDWGGIIALPMLIAIVFVITPVLTLILYRKSTDKATMVFKNFLITFVISIVLFILRYDF